MCTITYIPLESESYILTQNRDESILRPIAAPPLRRKIKDQDREILIPVDPRGGGTWIGASSDGRAAGIMNGGKKPYIPSPPYRHSRGLIITAYFRNPSFDDFYKTFDFVGLEPFTLFVMESGKILELVKDHDNLQVFERNAKKPHFFASRLLYSKESIEERRLEFYEWYYRQRKINENEVLNFHETQKFELERIKKNDTGGHILKTVSISQVIKRENKFGFNYYDAVNDLKFTNSIPIHKRVQKQEQEGSMQHSF